MKATLQRLRELIEINRAIVSSLDYDEVLRLVVNKAAAVTRADRCILLLADANNTARVAASRGVDELAARRFSAPLDERIHEALRDLLHLRDDDTFLGVPVVSRGAIHGLLAVYRKGPTRHDPEEEYLIEALADQAAIALAHASQYRELASQSGRKSRLLETIQSNTSTYLAYLDDRLRFLEANAAYLEALGRSAGEVVGRRYAEVVPDLLLARSLEEARDTGRPVTLREQPRRGLAGGRECYWDWSARPVRDERGAVEGIVVSAIDVTEKVLARRELELGSRRKSEFLAVLAHELRNPLAALATATEVLHQKLPDDPTLCKARDAAGRQLAHMTRLLDDLLDVSRITRGKLELKWEMVDLGLAIKQAVETNMPLVRCSEQELALDLPPERVLVRGDHARLVQVLSNLVSNASRYTPHGGHIQVALSRVDQEVTVRVSDDGGGIAPDVLPEVFDLFVQSPGASRSRQAGLGIGLTLVKQLTEMHGGAVEAHSEGIDQGSEFVVRLPAAVAVQGEPEPRRPARERAPTRQILLVEDNTDAAEMLKALLEMEGHAVSIATEGRAALEAAVSQRPDVVLLDIGLPQMDGYEVARQLQKQMAGSRPLVIALSGYSRPKHRRGAGESGIDYYLVKPVDPDELRALLRKASAAA